MPIQNLAANLVMAVCKYVGLHDHRIANHALDRKAPAIDLRLNALDRETAAALGLLVWRAPKGFLLAGFGSDRHAETAPSLSTSG